jgi:hypothetical protein
MPTQRVAVAESRALAVYHRWPLVNLGPCWNRARNSCVCELREAWVRVVSAIIEQCLRIAVFNDAFSHEPVELEVFIQTLIVFQLNLRKAVQVRVLVAFEGCTLERLARHARRKFELYRRQSVRRSRRIRHDHRLIELENGECAVPIAISAGSGGVCVLLTGGNVACWGGQANSGYRPKLITALSGAIAIAAGPGHTCAVLNDHTVKCLGSLTGADGISNAVALSAGNTFSCALHPLVPTLVPTKVIGVTQATAIAQGCSKAAQNSALGAELPRILDFTSTDACLHGVGWQDDGVCGTWTHDSTASLKAAKEVPFARRSFNACMRER